MISVTRVRISPDLSVARIYISIFPSDGQEDIMKGIQDHSPKIRYEIGRKVGKQLRIVPEISFFIDDSLDYIDNIDRILKS